MKSQPTWGLGSLLGIVVAGADRRRVATLRMQFVSKVKRKEEKNPFRNYRPDY